MGQEDERLITEDEVVEEEVTEEEETETEEVTEEEEELEEDPDAPVTFTEKQQTFIDDLIKTRLERQQTNLEKSLKSAAGTEVDIKDLTGAAKLWGFLKLNGKLSGLVQKTINEYVAKEQVVEPSSKEVDVKARTLDKREAILDLKAEDPYFAKYSKAILEFADDEGFEIIDAKSLKRAYLAYKGSRGILDKADEELRNKRKEPVKKKTKVAITKTSGSTKKSVDYRSMSDKDILDSVGVKLFTDD